MRFATYGMAVGLAACSGPDSGSSTKPDPTVTTGGSTSSTSPDTTPIDTTPTDTTDTAGGTTTPCTADYEMLSFGVVSVSGQQTLDPADPTRVLSFTFTVGSGPRIYSQTWTYDAVGRLVEADADLDGDGLSETTEDYTYDAAGNLTSEVFAGFVHGSVAYTHTYDASNLRIETTEDRGADGVLDRDSLFFYDTAGLLASAELDEDADGATDTWVTWLRDSAGREIELDSDDGDDGIYELVRTTTWDAYGNAVVDTVYPLGGSDRSEAWVYDGAGLPVSYALDLGIDGSVEETETWTYDTDGRVLTDGWQSATQTLSMVWTYDALGRLLTLATDGTSGSTVSVDQDETLVYLCP